MNSLRFCCCVALSAEGIRALGRAIGHLPQDLFAQSYVWVHWIPAVGYGLIALRVALKGTEE
jgi:hypothetical protein